MNAEQAPQRVETIADIIGPFPCAAFAALLDRAPVWPQTGAILPPLWHWFYALPAAPRAALGADGHPQRGRFLPDVALPRRMLAGGTITFHAPLRIGDAIVRHSKVISFQEKTGRSGKLAFVGVQHRVGRAGEPPAITEHHDIVYREAASRARQAAAAPSGEAWAVPFTADATCLFRYSALTFNGHRIHYDTDYARDVEAYPGLVVHGPLIATLLLEALREARPDRGICAYRFRSIRAVFVNQPFVLCGAASPACPGEYHVWARDANGHVLMDATAFTADHAKTHAQ